MNEQQEAYARAVADFTEKVHAIGPEQWTNPTPCTEWDVRALVNHLTYENLWVPELIGGRTVAEVGDRFDGDVLGDDPVGAWDRSAEGAIAAVTADGALDRTVDTSAGPTPASDYLDQIFVDAVIHGWDLARGIERRGHDPRGVRGRTLRRVRTARSRTAVLRRVRQHGRAA